MSDMPDDGALVVAMTYPSIEYDRYAERVSGTLSTRPSPFGGPPQCYVDGEQVDPRTVRAAGDAGDDGRH